MTEPRLTARDLQVWDMWMRTATVHARSQRFHRRVDQAKRIVDRTLSAAPSWSLMWSGGKDSTVLTHLASVELGARMPVASEKDDLDFPGERAYVEQLGAAWKLDLHILEPPLSPCAWFAANAHTLTVGDDVHGRAAALSKTCFYEVVERFSSTYDGVLLGLRQEESHGRRMNRATHGVLYQKRPSPSLPRGQWVATPIADWEGIDVYAYAVSRGIELLPLYQCVGLLHAKEPWRVRKSWWIPAGSSASKGGVAWLRYYWPSLYRQLVAWMPGAAACG